MNKRFFLCHDVGHVPRFSPNIKTKKKQLAKTYYNVLANGLLVTVGILYFGSRHFWEVVIERYFSKLSTFETKLFMGPLYHIYFIFHLTILFLFLLFYIQSYLKIAFTKFETFGNNLYQCSYDHGTRIICRDTQYLLLEL